MHNLSPTTSNGIHSIPHNMIKIDQPIIIVLIDQNINKNYVNMIQLPKLVKEKIQIYMNYQKWREQITLVHNQYKDLVEVDYNYDNEYTFLYYKVRTKIRPTYYLRAIIPHYHMQHRRNIGIFSSLSHYLHDIRVPSNYVYSSGSTRSSIR